jgi:hypothetical protein
MALSGLSPALTNLELHGLLDTIDLSMDAPDAVGQSVGSRPRRELTARQIEMRRKRNRESMRRVRVRKQAEHGAMRAELAALERRLAVLQVAGSPPHGSHEDGPLQAAAAEVARLEEEQCALRAQIHEREAFEAQLSRLLTDRTEALSRDYSATEAAPEPPRQDADELMDARDEFAWVQRVLPLLPALLPGCVSGLARESYLDTVRYLRLADEDGWGGSPSSSNVLGWSDRRVVDGGRATFLFAKAFAHEDVDALAAKTWTVLTLANQSAGFQVRDLHLRVVQRLNDDTLVMARNIYFPREERYYSALYVLVRVKTVDGYVISGRTILPAGGSDESLASALGPGRAYVYFHYGLSISRTTTLDEHGRVMGSGGCSVRYGGTVGPCTPAFAHSWAMDVLLAALRWESGCVGPLYRLTG